MKMKSLLNEAQGEIREEKMDAAKDRLKESIREIEAAKKVSKELEVQYQELLEEDVDGIGDE